MDTAFREKIGEDRWGRLIKRLLKVNCDIRERGIVHAATFVSGGFTYGVSDLLTGYSYGEFYDWDLYFENIYLSYFGIGKFCRNNTEAFLDSQLPCGFVSRSLIQKREHQHFKPFLAQIALLGVRQTGSCLWIKDKYYTRLQKYLEYWFRCCDFDKNGLCVWDSADASGMDNQDIRAGAMYTKEFEGADLNTYLVRELRAMAELARMLNLPRDAETYEAHASRLSDRINEVMWDEKDGFYYDRSEITGKPVKVKTCAGLLPLWAGIPTSGQAKRLITEHLLNPEEFWINYPVATLAKTEPAYYQQRKGTECNWLGPTWIPVNYMLFHGLCRYGYRKEAEKLAYRTFELVLDEEDTREYYNGETGCGQGLNPFWGWSTLGYFMPLEFELGYDPTDPKADIRCPAGSELSFSFGI